MSHFAKVLDGKVINVIVAEKDFFDVFVDDSPGQWIQTSYNTWGGVHYKPNSNIPSDDQSKALRKNFAGIGFTYDQQKDVFIPPQTFPSWILNEDTCLWEAPTPMPKDDRFYRWDEPSLSWVEL